MSKFFIVGIVSVVMTLSAHSAEAGGKHYRGHNYGYSGYHNNDIGDEILIGAGIIGGAILLSSLVTRPHYQTAPVYYAPARASYCVQDQVYRYLPDGRIQWGTRTRCQ